MFRHPKLALRAMLVATALLASHPATAAQSLRRSVPARLERADLVLAIERPDDPGWNRTKLRLRRQGEELWEHALDFRLFEVTLGRYGTVAGFGYTRPLSEESPLRVFAIAPSGEVLLDASEPRVRDEDAPLVCFTGAAVFPQGVRVVVHEAIGKLVLATAGPHDAWPWPWYVYDLDGSGTRARVPAEACDHDYGGSAGPLVAMSAVEGTGLTLVQWLTAAGPDEELGARFTLQDLEGRIRWTLDRPAEYALRQREPAVIDTVHEAARAGRMVHTPAEPGTFELYLPREQVCRRFRATRSESGECIVERVESRVVPLMGLIGRGSSRRQSDRLPFASLFERP